MAAIVIAQEKVSAWAAAAANMEPYSSGHFSVVIKFVILGFHILDRLSAYSAFNIAGGIMCYGDWGLQFANNA